MLRLSQTLHLTEIVSVVVVDLKPASLGDNLGDGRLAGVGCPSDAENV